MVVGSRGLGAFRRRFLGMVGLGSVSDYVAHHAPCTGGSGRCLGCAPALHRTSAEPRCGLETGRLLLACCTAL